MICGPEVFRIARITLPYPKWGGTFRGFCRLCADFDGYPRILPKGQD